MGMIIVSSVASAVLIAALFIVIFWKQIDVALCKYLLVLFPRLRLMWCRLYIRADEFHPSLDIGPVLDVCTALQYEARRLEIELRQLNDEQVRLKQDHVNRKTRAHGRGLTKAAQPPN
jgi:hypothetical protein